MAAIDGIPGGWRDPWDGPDDTAEIRARVEVEEQRHLAQVVGIGRSWQREMHSERRALNQERRRC